MKSASYIPYNLKITAIRDMSPDTKSLGLTFENAADSKKFDFTPGQFMIFSILGYGEVILAMTTTPKELPNVEVAVKSVGSTTKAIHRLKVGDVVGVRGPYGKGYPFEKLGGKEVLLIGGGLGIAPLRSLIRSVQEDNKIVGSLKIFCGLRTPNDILYKSEIKDWQKFAEALITVGVADGDWNGNVGFIPDLLDKTMIEKDAVAILCGPEPMLPPTIKKLKEKGIKDENIYILLERRMKCGIGKCQHCTCGEKYVCLDGPIFSYDELADNFEAKK